jgi:hypothetical protein
MGAKMDIETIMIIAFAVALIISIWKIYVFLPKKQLEDDDTTKEATEKLTDITIRSIIEGHEKNGSMTHKELFEHISSHKDFDKEHFWRFNQNRLNQLLRSYHLRHPHTSSLKDIYHNEKDKNGKI